MKLTGQHATRTLGIALAALLILPAATATQPAEAGKKFKTIIRTFSSSELIGIPESGSSGPANPYPTTIDVGFFKKFKQAKITDVNVTLHGFGHEDADEVDVLLVKGDQQALVMADAGSLVNVSGLTITLDDEAAEELQNGATLQSGTFRPANLSGGDAFPAPAPALNDNVALSTFDGLDPHGEWRLFVVDDVNGDTGSIENGWSVEITAKVKEKQDKKRK